MTQKHISHQNELGTNRDDIVKEQQRLRFTNELLAEEVRLAKDALSTALDKLGLNWSPRSRDYSVLHDILGTLPLASYEQALTASESQRIELLNRHVKLKQSFEEQSREKNDLLIAFTYAHQEACYLCEYHHRLALIVETELGNACWFLQAETKSAFAHLAYKKSAKLNA